MIYVMRSMTIMQGKSEEAWAWAIKITDYVKSNYPQLGLSLLRGTSGNQWQIHWLISYTSLSSYEDMVAMTEADEGYLEVISGAEDLVVQESWTDTFYRVVS